MADKNCLNESSALCLVEFGPTGLPSSLRGTLVEAVASRILRQAGEWPPYPTRVAVKAEGPRDGELLVEAVGPHAVAVCAALPQCVGDLLASTVFDSDGFVLEEPHGSGMEKER